MLAIRQAVQLWRRLWLIFRLRAQALAGRSRLDLDLAPHLELGKGIRISLKGGHNRITLGDRAHLGDRVRIDLRDGELYMGERGQLRDESVAHISGRLYLERACGFSIRCVIHCGKSIEVGRYSIFGEYVSILDGEHVHIQTDDYWFYGDPQARNVLEGVRIGIGVYIGAKTTIVMGAEIGDFSRIGANSVVTGRIEPHTLAAGVPARPIRKLV
jgi:carbonic anhydrase/acetyltransferase-like protein (isoleucine patch superfamily)